MSYPFGRSDSHGKEKKKAQVTTENRREKQNEGGEKRKGNGMLRGCDARDTVDTSD